MFDYHGGGSDADVGDNGNKLCCGHDDTMMISSCRQEDVMIYNTEVIFALGFRLLNLPRFKKTIMEAQI